MADTLTLSFEHDPFSYTIVYQVNKNITKIICTHTETCYRWVCTIADELCLVHAHFRIKISPRLLFNFLRQYEKDTLGANIGIIFPGAFSQYNCPIMIELIIVVASHETYVSEKLILIPDVYPDIEKLALKIKKLKKELRDNDTESTKLQKQLEQKVNQLQQDLASISHKINKIVGSVEITTDGIVRQKN